MDTEKYTKEIGLEIFKLMGDDSKSFFNKGLVVWPNDANVCIK